MKIRLDKWLGALNLGSRKQVQELVRAGKVRADGQTVRDPGESFDPETTVLEVGGKLLDGRLVRHVMLHKPAGVLTAARDPKQPTVMDLLDPVYARLGCMPVGRLDKDTTGLLLLTTDGELNHRLLSPERHVYKRYRATVAGTLTAADVSRFAEGLDLGDFTALPAELRILSAGEDTSEAEVTVREGKFHQVKRMFGAVDHEVLTLHRCSFGPLELDPGLQPGEWRELTEEETKALLDAAKMNGDKA
ncbi:MAG: rRNA pseudouridine synthase [Clostridia bacterium]|nr:rRNA pseudouridine synthase [Clostridia bacterium]